MLPSTSSQENTILTLEQALEVPMNADFIQEDQERNLYIANTFSFTSVVKSQNMDKKNASYTTVDINPASAITSEGYDTLRILGKSHAQLGITCKMYTAISYAILSIFKQRLTQEQYTQEGKNAWTKAIEITIDIMQGKASLTHGSKLKKSLSKTGTGTAQRIRKRPKKSAEHQQFSPESLHSEFLINLADLPTKSSNLSCLIESLSVTSAVSTTDIISSDLQKKLTENAFSQNMNFEEKNTRSSFRITNFDGLL
eukprot:Awhi_evm1s15235